MKKILPKNLADLAKACKAPAKHKKMQKWKLKEEMKERTE